jgi:hypothetical protein
VGAERRAVSVIGDFNDWNADDRSCPGASGDGSGIWELDVRGVAAGQRYKFAVFTREGRGWTRPTHVGLRVHLGSWRRGKTAGALLSYRDLAPIGWPTTSRPAASRTSS